MGKMFDWLDGIYGGEKKITKKDYDFLGLNDDDNDRDETDDDDDCDDDDDECEDDDDD